MTYSSVTPNDAERVVDDNFRGIRSSVVATALSVSSSQVACGKSAAELTSQLYKVRGPQYDSLF